MKESSKEIEEPEQEESEEEEEESNRTTTPDSSIVAATWLPLQIKLQDKILWTNPKPSSTRFCRPLRITFAKESDPLCKKLREDVEKEMEKTKNVIIPIADTLLKVDHQSELTMIDGKTFNVLTETKSNAVCGACKIKPSEMNDMKKIQTKATQPDLIKHGISNLHCYIRCLEYVLNVSIRLKIGWLKWKVTKDKKDEAKLAEEEIRKALREKLGILENIVKQGHDTTNDGNTSRKFFSNPKIAAQCTGFNEELLARLGTILILVNGEKLVNTELFKKFCMETYSMHIRLYKWYYLPAGVHRLLRHSWEVMQDSRLGILPLNFWSEEASEACNKLYRSARLQFARKKSRQSNLRGLPTTPGSKRSKNFTLTH
eukprot:Pompholyxophrys_punicea_v1_NODE_197_length_2826_cov_3.367737.p1 type:complete len:372 gc:universal NODE_197_length_2826_cov_3.367737:1830-715(-)